MAGPFALDPSVLNGMPLFAGLEAAALADVIRGARTRHVAKGGRLFAQGDPAAACHALVSGRVKIVQTGTDGQPVVLNLIGPGEMFATAAVFSGGVYPGEGTAIADCVELSWPAAVMTDLMRSHPQIAINALGIVGERVRELQSRVRELSTERVERRVACTLLRLVRHAGRPVEDGVAIAFPLTRQDVAEMTGTTLHTVSRILSGWEARGIVSGERQQLVVRDLRELAVLTGETPAEE